MPTYRLLIEYQGTRYSGWQEQRNARTVAGEIRAAAGKVVGRVVELGGAGRTDAGVHATGQVAHLRTSRAVDPARFRMDVNDLLPPDIHIAAVEPAPDRFHARHDAVLRSYVYQIAVRRSPFARRLVWWVRRPLDEDAIADAVSLLQGRHDFAQFCERAGEQESTVVDVARAESARDGGLILLRIAAGHFLWKMVRRIVGALVRVGGGEWTAGDIEKLLSGALLARGRGTVAEATAPPSGLFLERVLYPGEAPLGPLVPPAPVAAEPVTPPARH